MAVWVFTHSDGDGVCAGALALAANPDARVFFTHPYGLLGDLEAVRAGDKVIICDIAFSEDSLLAILERFSAISRDGELIYIDHHPLPEGLAVKDIPGRIVHDTGSSASELTYIVFREGFSDRMSRIAIYGAIADYLDDTPVISQLLCNWDKRTIYLETGILVQGLEGRKREHDFKREVIVHLASGQPPSMHKRLLESALENTRREEEAIQMIGGYLHVYDGIAYVLDFPFSLGKTAIYARALAGAIVGLAGERRKGFIDMSLRTYRRDIDLNRILRQITPKLGGSGGGHPTAAGARVPEENFKPFIEELNKAIKREEMR